MTPNSAYRTPAVHPLPLEMLSSFLHPSTTLPKLPVVLSLRLRTPGVPSPPGLAEGPSGARWQQARRTARVPSSRVGPHPRPLPLRAFPIPKEDSPPSVRHGTAFPAARPPALARSLPGSLRARGAFGDGTWRRRLRRRQRQWRGLLAWLPRAAPEYSRGSRRSEEAQEEDPGGCAPVLLSRRWRLLQVSEVRFPWGSARPRCPGAQIDIPTD